MRRGALVVVEELPPALAHRVRVCPVPLVHLVHEPGIGPERTARWLFACHVHVDATTWREGAGAGCTADAPLPRLSHSGPKLTFTSRSGGGQRGRFGPRG